MGKNFEVDWKKTKLNIKAQLKGEVFASAFSEQFCLSPRECQNKINPNNATSLTLSELAIIARYIGCDILDLVVLTDDDFVEPDIDYIVERKDVNTQTCEDVNKALELRDHVYEKYEIRNVYELLLYLPLIEDKVLRDVVFRCFKNLEYLDRHYIMGQLAYLHRSILESPAKEFADIYRDSVLRAKGDCSQRSWDAAHSEEYFENALRYASEGNCEHSKFAHEQSDLRWKQKYGVNKRCSTQDVEAEG